MSRHHVVFALTFAAIMLFSSHGASAGANGKSLYLKHCAMCHHKDRIGLKAPPLIPELISKANRKKLAKVIADGLPATQMPAFGKKLAADEIAAIAEFINSPAGDAKWSFADIKKSAKIGKKSGSKENTAAQKENITLVMEKGAKSLALLDGNDLSAISKFYVGEVHGGPKFSFGLDKVFAAARDGLITKYDIKTQRIELTIRSGIYLRSLAVSSDDKYVAISHNLPRNIVFFNNKLEPLYEIATPDKVGGFYSLPHGGFICSFRDLPELWIIDGDGKFGITKYQIPEPFEDFSISPVGNYILGTNRGGGNLYIYDYASHEVLAKIPTDGLPHLASATFWQEGGKLYAGVNHIKKPKLTILSLNELKAVGEIPLPSSGSFFVRTHFSTPWLWVDTMSEDIVLIDKKDFSKTKTIKPHPGKKALHIEFTRNGRYALITILGKDGEVAAYDVSTMQVVKRIPFNSAMGKYNATSKTYPAYSLGSEEENSEGKKLYDKYCMGCHHLNLDAFAPSFKDIASKRSKSQIRAHIVSPQASARSLGYNRSSMSKLKLTGKELSTIVDYVKSFEE